MIKIPTSNESSKIARSLGHLAPWSLLEHLKRRGYHEKFWLLRWFYFGDRDSQVPWASKEQYDEFFFPVLVLQASWKWVWMKSIPRKGSHKIRRGQKKDNARKGRNEVSWCGRGESNPALKLGKLTYYRYTTPARMTKILSGLVGSSKWILLILIYLCNTIHIVLSRGSQWHNTARRFIRWQPR